jgi:hypothetical protein
LHPHRTLFGSTDEVEIEFGKPVARRIENRLTILLNLLGLRDFVLIDHWETISREGAETRICFLEPTSTCHWPDLPLPRRRLRRNEVAALVFRTCAFARGMR